MFLRMILATAVLLSLTSASTAQFFDRSPTPSCTKTWTAVTFYERLDAMPPDIIEAFATLLGGNKKPQELASWIAERNHEWGATDVRPANVPSLRFIYGLKNRDRWFVWYEYGGIARGAIVVAFDSDPSTSKPSLVARLYSRSEEVCAVTYALMSARITPGGGLDNQ